jgi:hypothetical protein
LKRFIAAIAAALMLAVGAPAVASADGLPDPNTGYLMAILCPGSTGIVFYDGADPVDDGLDSNWESTIDDFDGNNGWNDGEIALTVGRGANGGCAEFPGDDFISWEEYEVSGIVTNSLVDAINNDSMYGTSLATNGVVADVTKYTFVHTCESFNNSPGLFVVSFSNDGEGSGNLDCSISLTPPAADPLTTSTPTLKRNGISFTPDNFDPTCAYEISTTAGTVKQNPVTGEVNVYGVGSGSSVTVTITDCTGATATVSGRATAATAPVQTLTKPTVATAADLITCSAGTSTVNPTSIAYTLLVDGVAVSTRFSDGAIAPSLVATTASQNLYSGATLSKASWTVDPAWAGKSYSCTTTSYASGAVGIANS